MVIGLAQIDRNFFSYSEDLHPPNHRLFYSLVFFAPLAAMLKGVLTFSDLISKSAVVILVFLCACVLKNKQTNKEQLPSPRYSLLERECDQ